MYVIVSCKNEEVPIKNALEWPQHFSHFKYMGIFSDAQWQLRAAVHGRIWSNFKLIRDFMIVNVTCKKEEDPIRKKNEADRMLTISVLFLQSLTLKGS